MTEIPATKVDEWTPRVKEMLVRKFGVSQEKRLSELLKQTGAIISGGSILNAIANYVPDDIVLDTDIYCPIDEVREFIETLILGDENKYGIFSPTEYAITDATLYCSSFLRRNGIRTIYTFVKSVRAVRKLNPIIARREARHEDEDENENERPAIPVNEENSDMNIVNSESENGNSNDEAMQGGGAELRVDVMFVRNKRSPEKVASNFDLTFCQVWYDGENVYATHPEHIREKKGILQGDYVKTFLRGNKFLIHRMQKYVDRGFTIEMDPAVRNSIELMDIFKGHQVIKGYNKCNRDQSIDEIQQHWFKRIVMFWTSNTHRSVIYDYVDKQEKSVLWIPLSGSYQAGLHENDRVNRYAPFREITRYDNSYGMEKVDFELRDEDGYDSEDFDIDEAVEKNYNVVYATFETNVELAMPLTTELKKKRLLTALQFNSMALHMTDDMQQYKYYLKYKSWLDYLKDNCLPEGEDMYGGEGRLMHIHYHPEDGAITQESLEAYLEGHIRDTDKNEVPCYYQPEPSVRGAPPSAKNCQQKLTLAQVRLMVSPEFYERYNKPMDIKTGLNQIIPAYNAMLYNTKTTDPLGFGDIYHTTMCPFCLQFENRDEGCIYMGHENPKKLPEFEHPYCLSEFVVKDLRDKYIRAGRGQRTLVDDHLEFCVECGRPCWGHQHFTLDDVPKLMPMRQVPNEENPERMVADYGSCQGGGRPEMYARVLAILEVYADPQYKDPKEERRVAAWKADSAAKDPVYLERGRKIFEAEVNMRKWNNEVPAKKKYNDPAYYNNMNVYNEAEGKEEDVSSNEAPSNEAPNEMQGGKQKKRRFRTQRHNYFRITRNRTQKQNSET